MTEFHLPDVFHLAQPVPFNDAHHSRHAPVASKVPLGMLYIYTFVGEETLNKEYKELCIAAKDNVFSNTSIRNLLYYGYKLENNKFNKMMYQIIEKNIRKYIAKYIGLFSKSQIEGTFYFGINDTGYTTGMPFYGILNIQKIKKMFNSIIDNLRGAYLDDRYITEDEQNKIRYAYVQCIKYEIIELEIPKKDTSAYYKLHTEQQNKLSEFEAKCKKINDMWDNYNYLYRLYILKLDRYKGKLVSYLINPELRAEIVIFILNDFEQNESLDKTYLQDIIEFYLHDDNYYDSISFCDGEIDEIIKIEYTPIRWLIAYKDRMLAKIKELKPVIPNYRPITNMYLKFFNNISNISSFLLPDIKIYLLKITIPYIPGVYCEYKYSGHSTWHSKQRAIVLGQVSCQ
jgi:hypothetical protein